MKSINDEKELQNFIADNPWLLDINYENVPSLNNNGLEYQAGDKKRIDLILKDRISNRPIIVEFKFSPFYRENIGQLLEYRARVTSILNKDENELYKRFKEYVSIPILILVVEECDDFSRIACNLSGIEVYEYKNFSKQLQKPELLKDIKRFRESYKNSSLPLHLDRCEEIENIIYSKIKLVLSKYHLNDGWTTPRQSNGYFFQQYNNMFINRHLFSNIDVSIGISEDFLDSNEIIISYYSSKKSTFNNFLELYKKNNKNVNSEWDDECGEGSVDKNYALEDFIKNTERIFESVLKEYIGIMKKMNITII
jgi:hypothetical protein